MKKKIVIFGGGNGSAIVLRALKRHVHAFDISAVISMSDSGGSSGRLRKEFGTLPPGDIMRAVLASSTHGYKQVLKSIFYSNRFEDVGKLSGHNVGNMFLTFAQHYTGDFMLGVRALEQAVGSVATVYPATTMPNDLVVKLANGEMVKSEHQIDRPSGAYSDRIVKAWLEPAAPASEGAINAIREADYLFFGPGSFYCSIVASLLPTGIREAIAESSAKLVYIAGDKYEREGEHGPTVLSEFVLELEQYLPRKVDVVIMNTTELSVTQMKKYEERKWGVIMLDKEALREYEIVDKSFEKDSGGLDPEKLGSIFCETFGQETKGEHYSITGCIPAYAD